MGPSLALKLVGECGTNLAAWPSAKHFTSWLALAPHNKISGGKVLSSKTRRTSNRAASLLRLAAGTVGRTDTALGAFYRRLSARVGKAKAITATARKIAVLFYVVGLTLCGLTAPMVLDGPMNGPAFLAYVEHVLVPTLKRGMIVVMDDLAAHRIAGVRTAIEAAGAQLLLLPPYSPDFPPPPPNSCAKPQPALSRASGRRSATPSLSSRPNNAQLLHRDRL